jgi:hypothetical protein
MIKPEITAEWARKMATTIMSEKVEKELGTCFTNIEAAVKRNEFYCHVSFFPHDLTKKELSQRGFKTKYHEGDQRDGGYFEISW